MSIRTRSSNLAFPSTWLGAAGGQARELIGVANALGLPRIRLGPHLNADPPEEMVRLFKDKQIQVVAIQNVLSTGGGQNQYLDGDTLSDPNAGEAEKSFALTLETAKAARSLGSKKVILHLGSVKDDRLRKTQEEACNLISKKGVTEEALDLIRQGSALLETLQEPWLDRTIRMLYRLIRAEPEITFCIENRVAFYEIPDLQGLGYIFEDLKTPGLKFWYNTGHARMQESLGLVKEGAWLDEFGHRTAGAHLQDAAGHVLHLPPGSGEVDFQAVLDGLPTDAERVIDLPPSASLEELGLGIENLRSLGF